VPVGVFVIVGSFSGFGAPDQVASDQVA